MQITKKTIPVILTVLFVGTSVWNGFAASVMEQFFHIRSAWEWASAAIHWLGMTAFVILPPALLFGERRCRALAVYALLPVLTAGACLAWVYFSLLPTPPDELAAYILSRSSAVAACVYLAAEQFSRRHKGAEFVPNGNILPRAAVLFLLVTLACFPLNFFMQFPALMEPKELKFTLFGKWHWFFIIETLASPAILSHFIKEKSKEEKFIALFMLSEALFFQFVLRFSYVRLHSYQSLKGIVSVLPLYVCTFGIAVLPFAILSRSPFFQSVLFLVNTPGAIVAFVWPPMEGSSVWNYNVTCFVFSHILLFAITANMALHLEAKPQKKHLMHLPYMIAAYYAVMLLLNTAAIRLSSTNSNPNFSFISKSPLPIALEKVWAVNIGPFTFSPLYYLVLVAVQYALALITYLIYRAYLRFSRGTQSKGLEENEDLPLKHGTEIAFEKE